MGKSAKEPSGLSMEDLKYGKFKIMKDQLKIIDSLPKGFLEIQPKEITKLLAGPALIHLKGEKEPPFFISVILHGNEYSGLLILQRILKKYQTLPVSLIIFIGNPRACAQNVRHLPNQPDFNRIWNPNSFSHSDFEYYESLARPVLQYAKDHKIQSAIDIHNNTGQSPIYACVSQREKESVRLAQIFSKNIVYFTNPDSVLSIALSQIAPSIVIECGLPGENQGIDTAVKMIESLLDDNWKQNSIQASSVYHTQARLYVSSDLSFHPQPALQKDKSLCFIEEWDQLNFKLLRKGDFLGKASNANQIRVIDKKGQNVFHQFFSIQDNHLRVKSPFIPGMLTKNTQIAKTDCLGYVMEKWPMESFLNQ